MISSLSQPKEPTAVIASFRFFADSRLSGGQAFQNNWHRLTLCPPLTSQRKAQMAHITSGHQWRKAGEECRSFWSEPMDSNFSLICVCFCLHSVCNCAKRKITCPATLTVDHNGVPVEAFNVASNATKCPRLGWQKPHRILGHIKDLQKMATLLLDDTPLSSRRLSYMT